MFQPKDSVVDFAQLSVQKLSLPFTLTHNATPASKTYTKDNPGILFLQFQGTGLDEITAELSRLGDTLSFQSPVDASSTFNALVLISEPVSKIVSGKLVYRDASGSIKACPVAGISSPSGFAIGFNCVAAASLATTDIDCSLEVEYIVKQS